MEDYNDKWQLTLDTFKELLPALDYNTWFQNLTFTKVESNIVYLEVKKDVVKTYLMRKYEDFISDTIKTIFGEQYDFIINIYVKLENNEEINLKTSMFTQNSNDESNLNSKFTFDSYVVGGSNKFAFDASVNVANSPGETYNPLYLYGDVGLGKTHLMQAIGNFIKDNSPNKRVLYVSSEKFLSDFLKAVRFEKNTSSFREKYRSVDVLLIDDIQFFINKPETQEEFFHTFNALYEENKQIILTSDKPPQQIDNLEERLKSRFEMGLVADIQTPNLETRMAIIKEKSYQIDKTIDFPNDVVEFIADGITSNVRRLEGAVQKVIAYSKLTNSKITINLAKEALKDLINQKPSQITIGYIQEVVASFCNLTSDDLKAKKRSKDIALTRQIAMFLSRKLTDTSYPKIGEEFGGRDHTTVLHACSKIEQDINSSKEFREKIELLEQKITLS